MDKVSQPDIAYIVHQYARFLSAPKNEHAQSLRCLGRYLKGTKDKVTLLIPRTVKIWKHT